MAPNRDDCRHETQLIMGNYRAKQPQELADARAHPQYLDNQLSRTEADRLMPVYSNLVHFVEKDHFIRTQNEIRALAILVCERLAREEQIALAQDGLPVNTVLRELIEDGEKRQNGWSALMRLSTFEKPTDFKINGELATRSQITQTAAEIQTQFQAGNYESYQPEFEKRLHAAVTKRFEKVAPG